MTNIPEKFFNQAKGFETGTIIPGGTNELAKLFCEADKEKKKLRIKLGIDPTNTDLHLGHTVCLHILRKFQELGHLPVLIIGGFTAQVGDPSGRNEARPPLTLEEVKENAKTYIRQISKIIDVDKIEITNNYDWLSKLNSADIIKLSHLITVNRLIAKEAFGNRLQEGQPLFLHEVLYPILQGYDSQVVKADIEIGGTDQTFNVLFGRDVQRFYKQKEQIVMLFPLLIGLDGTKKMSKSFKNYIALNDPPNEIFGKTMSIHDELIIHYFKLVSNLPQKEIIILEKELKEGKNPRDIKIKLAHNLVLLLYGKESANSAEETFIKQFKLNEIPESIEEYELKEPLKIVDLMYLSKLVSSKSEAKRLIENGGVKLKSNKISDPNLLITKNEKNAVLQVGKRKFVKII